MPMSGKHNNVLTNVTAIYVEIIKSARPIPYSNSEKNLLLITILLSKTANRNTPIIWFCCLVETRLLGLSSSETKHIKNKSKKEIFSS